MRNAPKKRFVGPKADKFSKSIIKNHTKFQVIFSIFTNVIGLCNMRLYKGKTKMIRLFFLENFHNCLFLNNACYQRQQQISSRKKTKWQTQVSEPRGRLALFMKNFIIIIFYSLINKIYYISYVNPI